MIRSTSCSPSVVLTISCLHHWELDLILLPGEHNFTYHPMCGVCLNIPSFSGFRNEDGPKSKSVERLVDSHLYEYHLYAAVLCVIALFYDVVLYHVMSYCIL